MQHEGLEEIFEEITLVWVPQSKARILTRFSVSEKILLLWKKRSPGVGQELKRADTNKAKLQKKS